MSKSTQEKVRVYALAKELKVENKQVLELCQELGFVSITNQLHGLDQPQVDAVKKRIKEGPKHAAPTATVKPAAQTIPPPSAASSKVRTLPPPKPKTAPKAPAPVEPTPAAEAAPGTPGDTAPASPSTPAPKSAEMVATVDAPQALARPEESTAPGSETPAAAVVEAAAEPAPTVPPPLPPIGTIHRGMPNLNANRPPVLRAAGGRPANTTATRPSQPSANTAAPAIPPTPPVSATTPPTSPTAATTPPPPAASPVTPPPASPAQPASPGVPAAGTSPPASPSRPANQPLTGNPQHGRPMMNLPSQGSPRPSGGPGGQQTSQTPGTARPPQPAPPSQQRPGGNFPPPRVAPPTHTAPYRGPNQNTPHAGPSSGPPGAARPGPTPAGGRLPGPNTVPKGQVRLTPDQIAKLREAEKKKGGKVDSREVLKVVSHEKPASGADAPSSRGGSPASGTPGSGAPTRSGVGRPAAAADDDDKPKRGPGEVAGRDSRTKHRNRDRGGSGSTDKGAIIIGAGGQVDLIEQASGSRKGPRAALLAKLKRRQGQVAVKREGPIEIALPITVRSLSEAIGMKVGELSKQLLKETAQLYGANSPIAFDVAELIAIGKGITLVAKKVETAEDILLTRFKKQAEEVEPETLRPRPPIVTIMGHVDHGKTSLLDKIRQEYGLTSDVVSTEAGGITQVIRAWRVEKDGKPTTFLDTPGHEAFTKMRARGAKVTDIAVIVVAATDGVMPQTEEAINHAKAAKVKIIVAINKVDMPNANVDKTRRQLYSLELLPDNMGGDVPFVETSAVTGQGIGELLDNISIVAELSDPPLMADPEHKPSGTCLEAYMEGERGVMATLLVQQGTLHKGDVILCGATYGRVRAMYDDLGRPIDAAGPSTPVKVVGLNEVPDADDPFYFVDDVTEAREIAEARATRIMESGRSSLAPKSLAALQEANARAKISELKIVLKAEARGSVEAIKKELEKLTHEEVRCRILHSGIGAINESDVTLALTSPADTLIIGFNVTADDEALRLAQERGISLREYDIIYKLTDDVKAALEGRLKPTEEVVHLGRAVVRDTFKISKVGTIAGCYVTSGVIERSARVRVIREGTVIYPPSEKTLGLDSLKRFKDDAKEVREGFECGLKIVGFDDVKVGDVIEAFRIEIRQRTL